MNMEEMKKPHSSLLIHRLSLGFTLIEVMLVVVIVLIAAGISVPLFKKTFQSTQMTDAVRSTVRIARYARNVAILKQQTCTLSFETNRLTLACDDGTTNNTFEAARRLPDGVKIS